MSTSSISMLINDSVDIINTNYGSLSNNQWLTGLFVASFLTQYHQLHSLQGVVLFEHLQIPSNSIQSKDRNLCEVLAVSPLEASGPVGLLSKWWWNSTDQTLYKPSWFLIKWALHEKQITSPSRFRIRGTLQSSHASSSIVHPFFWAWWF